MGRPAGFISPMKGKHFPPEVRARMGRQPGFVSEKRGRPRTPDERAAIRAGVVATMKTGAASHSWRGGKTESKKLLRKGAEYKAWRIAVFQRDRFTCIDCGDARGGNLHAHHIKSWSEYPELRFDVANGVTVCITCHKKRHAKVANG